MKEELIGKIKQLEQTVKVLTEQVELLQKGKTKTVNKDGLPLGIKIYADVKSVGKISLIVRERNYQVNGLNNAPIYEGYEFNSLSSAAEFFSKIKRKSGWVYWRTENGRTLKDAFKG